MNEPFFDAMAGIDLELPGPGVLPIGADGRTVNCRTLEIREATRFLRLLISAEMGNAASQLAILDTFPAAVGIEKEHLTPPEVFEVLRRFLSHRRTALSGSPMEMSSPARSSTPGPT